MTPEAQKIEAMLFLAGEPVGLDELGQLIDRSEKEVPQYVREVGSCLEGHGLTLIATDRRVQLATAPDVAGFLKRYIQDEAQELSASAAETLAIIAYRGPISRMDIDAIRGVDSRRILRQLVARDLIEKRIDSKAILYAVSEGFLQHMGLRSVEELPDYGKLRDNDHKGIAQDV